MIYVIKVNDKVKIGYSEQPKEKVTEIQDANPDQVEVLLIIEGDYSKEQKLRQKFKDLRVKTSNEWMKFGKTIEKFVKENKGKDRKLEFGFGTMFDTNEQISKLRKFHDLTLEKFGEKLDMTYQGASKLIEREKEGGITVKTLQNVASAFGYKLEYKFTKKEEKDKKDKEEVK